MHFKFRNVNDAFYGLVKGIHENEFELTREMSRNGEVLKFDEPVIVTYEKPKERVLLNKVRDCNPFFHLFESLWMLHGSNELLRLLKYVSTFGQFSDDGRTLNGAYGYRWRKPEVLQGDAPIYYKEVDQLNILIEHLRKTPTSRRAVLQMWNVEDDLLKIDSSKDVCCNTAVYFSIRSTDLGLDSQGIHRWQDSLDMTVTNRSNDLIWGMLGANAVHFSFLQEFMADCLGVEVGVYNQISNNLHLYTENNSGWKPEEWLSSNDYEDYPEDTWKGTLVEDKDKFESNIKYIVKGYNTSGVEDPFLKRVVLPALRAFDYHKHRQYSVATSLLSQIEDEAWRIACTEWINKRKLNWEKKNVY